MDIATAFGALKRNEIFAINMTYNGNYQAVAQKVGENLYCIDVIKHVDGKRIEVVTEKLDAEETARQLNAINWFAQGLVVEAC